MTTEIPNNNQISRKMFAYRIYPTKQQEQALLKTLNLCCELYNNSLEERKEAYRLQKQTISFNQQSAQLPEVKELKPELKGIHSQILQDVLHRLDKAMQAFFRRVRKGKKPGYPLQKCQ